jgi:hypothetical protein
MPDERTGEKVASAMNRWSSQASLRSFENSRSKEHLGTKCEVVDLFQFFNMDLIEQGYTRMNFATNSDPSFSAL